VRTSAGPIAMSTTTTTTKAGGDSRPGLPQACWPPPTQAMTALQAASSKRAGRQPQRKAVMPAVRATQADASGRGVAHTRHRSSRAMSGAAQSTTQRVQRGTARAAVATTLVSTAIQNAPHTTQPPPAPSTGAKGCWQQLCMLV
jgi:hypothetical protein